MRWSAVTTVRRAVEAGLVDHSEQATLAAAALAHATEPGAVPTDATGRSVDLRLAELALGLALRRHAGRQRVAFGPSGRLVERDGTDLREVDLLVGSGGVLRHATPDAAIATLRSGTGDPVPGGWLVPRQPRLVIDRAYVLAAAGLLAGEHPRAAYSLLRRYLSA
jgi:uncharacterized protein (TIGR01319 family)